MDKRWNSRFYHDQEDDNMVRWNNGSAVQAMGGSSGKGIGGMICKMGEVGGELKLTVTPQGGGFPEHGSPGNCRP